MPYHGSGSRREERKGRSRERNSSRADRNREGERKGMCKNMQKEGMMMEWQGVVLRWRAITPGGPTMEAEKMIEEGGQQGGGNPGRSYNDPYMMHDDSGMGMMQHSPYGNPFYDGFNMGGRGAWGGRLPFNRPYMPSPVFGMGQGRGRMTL